MAIRVIEILEGYHARLLAASRGLDSTKMFDRFPNPMPLTIGQLHAGNWPSTAPPEALLEGVLGLLPNRTARQVMDEMTAAIRDEGGGEIAENFTIHFTYRHDSSVCPADHPLVKALVSALGAENGDGPRQGQPRAVPILVDAMTASCDAWFYNNQLGIPTVVFGGGSLGVAHSAREQMPLADLAKAARAIAALAIRWCGRQTP
jgi:acetylornithine deacetylase